MVRVMVGYHHIALSTFNDFSSRHVLVTAIVVMVVWSDVLGDSPDNGFGIHSCWVLYSMGLSCGHNGSSCSLMKSSSIVYPKQCIDRYSMANVAASTKSGVCMDSGNGAALSASNAAGSFSL